MSTGLLLMVLGLAVLLLLSTLSVDVASQVLKSYLEFCKSLELSKAFLKLNLCLLRLVFRQVCLLFSTTAERCACDKVQAAEWDLNPL